MWYDEIGVCAQNIDTIHCGKSLHDLLNKRIGLVLLLHLNFGCET